eukprot:1892486-Karenia_brevis.AAC.1
MWVKGGAVVLGAESSAVEISVDADALPGTGKGNGSECVLGDDNGKGVSEGGSGLLNGDEDDDLFAESERAMRAEEAKKKTESEEVLSEKRENFSGKGSISFAGGAERKGA